MTGPALDAGGVALGCMGMSWAYAPSKRDRTRSREVIALAVEQGVGMVDTADVYGLGANEELVGDALRPYRGRVLLATKGGLVKREGRERPVPCGTPQHLRAAVDASLRRLGVDAIELYYLHRTDPAVPLDESWGALAELVAAGKLRHLGLSEVTAAQAATAHAIHPVSAVQSELSLWSRDRLTDVLPWCAANGAVFVAFAPLGRGFLTGRLTASFEPGDLRATMPRFAPQAWHDNQRIVEGVRDVARLVGATPAQVALAWVLSRGAVALAGTTSPKHLMENVSAARVRLDAAACAMLDELPVPTGERY